MLKNSIKLKIKSQAEILMIDFLFYQKKFLIFTDIGEVPEEIFSK